MQKEGREFQARQVQFQAGPGSVVFSLDLAGAYPPAARVQTWKRTLTLDRVNSQIELAEEYQLQSWVKPFSLSLMTPLKASVSESGQIRLVDEEAGRNFTLAYAAEKFQARVEEIPLTDSRLKSVWGNRLARILLDSKGEQKTGQYIVTLSAGIAGGGK
jgi:hypothetical protein